MQWLPATDVRAPVTPFAFLSDCLGASLCHYATAVLVQLPDNLHVRLALLPLTLLLSFRAAVLDYSQGDRTKAHFNQLFGVFFVAAAMRSTMWTFQTKPLRRLELTEDGKNNGCSTPKLTDAHILYDAADLVCSMRGQGWNYQSPGLHIPRETHPTTSTTAFIKSTSFSILFNLILCDIFLYWIQRLSPAPVSSTNGGSIFDPTLPPFHAHLRSSIITTLAASFIHSSMTLNYYVFAILAILFFGQHPSVWPPLFDRPWRSTSLTEFWSKGWHQVYRNTFLFLAIPLSFIAGRVGRVVGSFLISEAFHSYALWTLGSGPVLGSTCGYFLINAVGVLAEQLWRRLTGRRVGGIVGWVWMAAWLTGWGYLLVDPWAQKGLYGCEFFPVRLSVFVFGPLPKPIAF